MLLVFNEFSFSKPSYRVKRSPLLPYTEGTYGTRFVPLYEGTVQRPLVNTNGDINRIREFRSH